MFNNYTLKTETVVLLSVSVWPIFTALHLRQDGFVFFVCVVRPAKVSDCLMLFTLGVNIALQLICTTV